MTSVNNIETEYLEITRKMEWHTLFQTIRTKSSDNKYTFAEAAKPQNQEFNRYRDVNPYDHSRIVLKKGPTDYINANLVKLDRANRQYILTQGPTVKTISHFWLMVWEQNTAAIIMLNKLIEKKQEKCSQYWPAKIGPDHVLKLEDVGLQVEYISHSDFQHYLTRQFRLTELSGSESRTIVQYHYTTWPDFGVPGSPTVFLEFLRRVRAQGVLDEAVGPAVVHCSAGIGRSGTFCLVDSVLVLIEKDGQNSVDVKEILLEMRKFRMGLIQTHEQLRFSYQAIIEGAKNLSCADKDNCNLLPAISTTTTATAESPTGSSTNNGVLSTESSLSMEDEDEPPPLPPPRGDSLAAPQLLARPPISNSKPGVIEEEEVEIFSCPSGPLPQAPPMDEDGSSEDELEDSSYDGDDLLEEIEASYIEEDDDDVYDDMVESNSVHSNDSRGNSKAVLMNNVVSGGGDGSDVDKSDQNENERTTTSPITTTTIASTTAPNNATDDPNNPPTLQSPTSPAAEQRQRRRHERQQLLAAQVREMKRRQRSNERQQNNGGVWRQLKRSCYDRLVGDMGDDSDRGGRMRVIGGVGAVTVAVLVWWAYSTWWSGKA